MTNPDVEVRPHWGLAATYAAAVFVSATLVFSAQPLLARMVLPLFGGSPSVWNTCMLFFQVELLAGYGYSHFLTSRVGLQKQKIVHLSLLTLAGFLLPFHVVTDWATNGSTSPIISLISLLVAAAGLPFFAVSTTAPLLQAWFGHSRHASAKEPYFLYAISNVGSMAVLLAYPTLIEPLLGLSDQRWVWAVVYGGLFVLMAGCVALTWKDAGRSTAVEPSEVASCQLSWRQRGAWVVLSFVPSSWLLSSTVRLTTDFAPIPLLWILPLALYLLTFIIVFSRRQVVSHEFVIRAFPYAIVMLVATMVVVEGWWPGALINVLVFFVGSLLCHGELAKQRPDKTHLTEYFLWMSFGGALGGVFNSIVAPLAFPVLLEFPIIVVVACLCRPNRFAKPFNTMDAILTMITSTVIALGVSVLPKHLDPELFIVVFAAVVVSLAASILARPKWVALISGVTIAWSQFHAWPSVEVVHRARSFFGIHEIDEDMRIVNADTGRTLPRFRRLKHGTTQHGFQSIDAGLSCEPLAYYHRQGPLADVFGATTSNSEQRVAVIGLGTGAMACYANPRRHFVFFEIDPVVTRIAQDPKFFSYLSDCSQKRYDIVIGDGRLMIAREPDHSFDMIVLDAFSSDAIPTHLLTLEALEIYATKLKQQGLLVFHVSNRFLDLPTLLADSTTQTGWSCLVCKDWPRDTAEHDAWLSIGKADSTYVVMAQEQSTLEGLKSRPRWRPQTPRTDSRPWTDDYSNLISIMRWNYPRSR